tara:strand:- start:2697 stop:2957 length:261 start_codon:yes stop_codon:yes gene_type:complete
MLFNNDEVFDYIDTDNNVLTVSWNLDDDEVEITTVEFLDDCLVNQPVDGDDMWDSHYDLTEDIVSYIHTEFLESEEFWLEKHGYDL